MLLHSYFSLLFMYLPVNSPFREIPFYFRCVAGISTCAKLEPSFRITFQPIDHTPAGPSSKSVSPHCFSSERIIFCLNLLCGFQVRLFISDVSFPSHLCIHSGCGTVPTLSSGTRIRVLMRDSNLRSRWITILNPCTSMGRLL